jgi:hypothetical protein
MKKKSWRKQSQQIVIDIGPCKYCGKDMLNTDSFVAFMDKTKAHYICMKKDDEKRSEKDQNSDSNLF